MPNQYKPLVPPESIQEYVEYYWDLGKSDVQIVDLLKDHYDMDKYTCRVVSLRRLRKSWGLLGTRQQQHTHETIAAAVREIRARFPAMGARQMVVHLRLDYQMRVPEQLLSGYLKLMEPEEVRARFGRRFKRKRFWAAGVNDIVAMDQHDKWQRFGLWLHLGLEPYAGQLRWLKIWWTNKNPKLIAKYYLDSSRRIGGVPLVTQSDPGSENFGVANCHTTIRHRLDPSLSDTLQHRWMRNKANVKPEIAWGLLRRTWTEGFESVLDYGLNNGIYEPGNHLEKLVFYWIAVPWLQAELDSYMRKFNMSSRRADKNKVLPQDIPDLITAKPERYCTVDFKVLVPPELFDEMEAQWAPPDDHVFQLVPPEFDAIIQDLYAGLGRPAVSKDTIWNVFSALLTAFQALAGVPDFSDAPQSRSRADPADDVPLLPNLRELRHGAEARGPLGLYYMGGLENPPAWPGADDRTTPDGPEQQNRHGGGENEGSDNGDDERQSEGDADDSDRDLRIYAYFSDCNSD